MSLVTHLTIGTGAPRSAPSTSSSSIGGFMQTAAMKSQGVEPTT